MYKLKSNKKSFTIKEMKFYLKDYTKSSSHSNIEFLCLDFALKITRANSLLKCRRQPTKEGGISSEIRSFICIYILQQKRMMTSMKKGRLSWALTSSKAKKGSSLHKNNVELEQHACAKGQIRNRWGKDSSTPKVQQPQLQQEHVSSLKNFLSTKPILK